MDDSCRQGTESTTFASESYRRPYRGVMGVHSRIGLDVSVRSSTADQPSS